MSDTVADTLNRLVTNEGEALIRDWQRLRGLLNDIHPKDRRDVGVLVQAAQYGIPNKLEIASRSGIVITSSLAQGLHNDLGMDYQIALWAVRTWATALHIQWHDDKSEIMPVEKGPSEQEKKDAEKLQLELKRQQEELAAAAQRVAERERVLREQEAERQKKAWEQQRREQEEAERRRIEYIKQQEQIAARKRTIKRSIGTTLSCLGIGLIVWLLFKIKPPPPGPPITPPVVTSTVEPSPTAVVPPPFAYAVGDPGKADIHVQNAGMQFSFADPNCDEAEPDWSPDETRVAFQSNCAGSYDLAEFDLQANKGIWLTSSEEFDELEPNFSSDGKKIVFQRVTRGVDRNHNGEILSLDLGTRQITDLHLLGRAPVWSPDMTRLAYMSIHSGRWLVYIHNLLSSAPDEMISINCPSHCRWPEWSPDGHELAYASTMSTVDLDPDSIWIYSENDRSSKKWMGGGVGRPSWSSTGLIAFNSGNGIEYAYVDGSSRQLLVQLQGAWAPAWSK